MYAARYAAVLFCLTLSATALAGDLLRDFQKRFREELGPMTFVFVPGYRVAVDGTEFPIYGRDLCPEAETAKVYVLGGGFDYVGKGTHSCVVVEPSTKEVVVQRPTDDGPVIEIWRVERDAETLRLWTADGKSVAEAGDH